jgi:hypothetical protein
MKLEPVENIVVDEVHDRTFVVMADRTLTDGELYRAIRLEILRRGKPPARGERLVISNSRPLKSKEPREVAPEAPAQPAIGIMKREELG